MDAFTTKDSGQREDYPTGARRDVRVGKGRYDLLSPLAIRRLAGVYERGAAKYGDRNYEKGIPLTRYLDSALRHTFQALEGATDEDHAAQAAWNLLAFITTQELIGRGSLPPELNDLPDYGWRSAEGGHLLSAAWESDLRNMIAGVPPGSTFQSNGSGTCLNCGMTGVGHSLDPAGKLVCHR